MTLSIFNSMGDDWYSLSEGGGWASVEGTDEQWLAIAAALREGTTKHFTRLAFYRADWCFGTLSSPRNSTGENDCTSIRDATDAKKLADEIERVLRADARPCIYIRDGFDPIAMGC